MCTSGMEFWRFAPVSWAAMFLLAFITNATASAGYGTSDVQLQSLILLTTFAAALAVAGTAQRVSYFRETGQRRRAWIVTSGILLFAAMVVTYGVQTFGNGV